MSWVIFDTNIYVKLITDYSKQFKELSKKLAIDSTLRICGLNSIKKEIKDALKGDHRKYKEPLLEAYELICEKEYKADEKCKGLAEAYFEEYKRLKKRRTKRLKHIKTDLLIYACATINGLDIVYSGDRETLNKSSFAPEFTNAYRNINTQLGKRDPEIKTYENLNEYIKKTYKI